MRLFVAIYPPADAVDHLAAFVADLHVGKAHAAGVNTRLAPRETYHLTIAFLGEVTDAGLPNAEAAISAAVTSWHTRAARDRRRAGRRDLQREAGVAAGELGRAAGRDLQREAGVAAGELGRAAGRDLQREAGVAAGELGRAAGRDLQREAGVAAGDLGRATRRSRAPDVEAEPVDLVGAAPAFRAKAEQSRRISLDRGEVQEPPQVWIEGGGRFGRGRFSVLWAGVHGETERLAALTRVARRELKRARLPYDERPWKPHLTIARPGDRVDRAQVGADRVALAAYRGPAWPASELVLVRSHLGPRPSYDRLTGWPL